MGKIRDLSTTVRSFALEPNEIRVVYSGHEEGRRRLAKIAGVRADRVVGLASEVVTTFSHAGTHVDAPWHFGPTSEGRPAKTIDRVPLDWCFGDGVLLDFSRSKKPGEYITAADLQEGFDRMGYRLKPMDIVLLRTGAEDYEDDVRFEIMASGLDLGALHWLLDRGIKHIATDAYTLDIPVPRMVEELKKGNLQAFFPTHYAGREREYIHTEKVSGLRGIPQPFGFKVALFPVKIEGAAGGWTRAAAIEGEGALTSPPRLLDLSVPLLSPSMEAEEVAVVRGNHEEAARRFCKRRGAALNVLPSPDFFVNDEITCSSHAGTHVDAPWHFGPTVEGRPAKTIDQVPLEWFYGDGVLLDFSRKKPDDPIAAPDLVKELDRIGYTLKPEDIVLLRTGAEDHFFDDPHFQDCATGLTGDAFLWLLDQGIRTLGTDAYTLEMSFEAMLRGMRNGDPAAFFPVHRNAVRKECCQAVKLCNLKEIPHPIGFKVALFPTKLEKGSAGWARAVAILL